MSIVDIFSKRLKRNMNEDPDVYQYTEISKKFRVQAIHIIDDGIGERAYINYDPSFVYEQIHKTLCREYGVFSLKEYPKSNQEAIFDYLLRTKEYSEVLDIIELSLIFIDNYVRKSSQYDTRHLGLLPDDAINDLNVRFKENGIGYRYESGKIIKIDSEIIHKELIKPTLKLLQAKEYINANNEYLEAFEHYRHGRNNDCLVSCLKSFESVMKILCDKNKWAYNQNDTAKKLINTIIAEGLIPTFMQNQITSLRTLLESGVPTLRNKLGGHGQGVNSLSVDDNTANYALNLTASNIKYLIGLSNAKQ